jgi:hypothetical protein
VQHAWTRFISNGEEILMSDRKAFDPATGKIKDIKGMTREQAQKNLNKEIFGQSWEQARVEAEKIMRNLNAKGADLRINKDTIERFTADVVKAQLLRNKVFTADEMKVAWDAATKTAGLEMGHVANNMFAKMLNHLKKGMDEKIEGYLTKGQYNQRIWKNRSPGYKRPMTK